MNDISGHAKTYKLNNSSGLAKSQDLAKDFFINLIDFLLIIALVGLCNSLEIHYGTKLPV